MRVGLVSPYAVDQPGGVQQQVLEMAHELNALNGVEAFVACPGPPLAEDPVTGRMTWVGRAHRVSFNGATARVAGPWGNLAALRSWVEHHNIQVLHLHEPTAPSLSRQAARIDSIPTVFTYHSAHRASVLRRVITGNDPLFARTNVHHTAVSDVAAQTVQEHHRIRPRIIANGLNWHRYAQARPHTPWQGTTHAPTIATLGRIDDPRKGISLLATAFPALSRQWPGLRLLVAGPGDTRVLTRMTADNPHTAGQVHLLGAVSESDKARLLASVDLFIAPHRGGESFGMVVAEAMAAGRCVVASDLTAFVDVLGPEHSAYFANGDAQALTAQVDALLRDHHRRHLLGCAAQERACQWDWSQVLPRWLQTYREVLATPAAGRWVSLERTRSRAGH